MKEGDKSEQSPAHSSVWSILSVEAGAASRKWEQTWGAGLTPGLKSALTLLVGAVVILKETKWKDKTHIRDKSFRGQKFKKGFIFNVKREGELWVKLKTMVQI